MGIGMVVVVAAADARAALRALPDAIAIGGVERARPNDARVRWASTTSR
jgi:phosphoribosylaminoimidazole (AIR) synthetase